MRNSKAWALCLTVAVLATAAGCKSNRNRGDHGPQGNNGPGGNGGPGNNGGPGGGGGPSGGGPGGGDGGTITGSASIATRGTATFYFVPRPVLQVSDAGPGANVVADPLALQTVVRNRIDDIAGCFMAAPGRAVVEDAVLTLHITVNASGVVRDVRVAQSTGQIPPAASECALGIARSLQFPASSFDDVEIDYPIHVRADLP